GASERQDTGAATPASRLQPQSKLVSAFLELVSTPSALELSTLQIATQLGVPLRTLQENVLRELGATLAEVLRRQRLRAARTMLLDADPTRSSVTEIALRCGFRHLGRFSVEYRQAFGEKPSETLRLLP